MSGGVWRQVETVRREKVEKICLITSWYCEELLLEPLNTRDCRDLLWILWFCICVQFPKLANDENVLVSKYLHSAEAKPGMLSESCAFLRELCFFCVNPSNLFAFLVFFDSSLNHQVGTSKPHSSDLLMLLFHLCYSDKSDSACYVRSK